MKIQDFNIIYQNAKLIKIVDDSWFNTMGWFWLQLSEKQVTKMFNLMKEQGAKVYDSDNKDFKYYIQLRNGIRIYQ